MIKLFFNWVISGEIVPIAKVWAEQSTDKIDPIIANVVIDFIFPINSFALFIGEGFLFFMLISLWYLSTIQKYKVQIVAMLQLVLIITFVLLLSNPWLFGAGFMSFNVLSFTTYAWYSKLILLIVVFPLLLLRSPSRNFALYVSSVILFGFFIINSSNLISFYIALEGLSILSYGIIASSKTSGSSEAALKYYIYGVIASALLIYGISLQYLTLKTLDFSDSYSTIALYATSTDTTLFAISFLLIFSAFMYKLSMFPFHFTLPDVYEGTSWSVIAIINLGIKFSISLAFFHFWNTNYANVVHQSYYSMFITLIAIVSIIIGCFGALLQNSLKRFFAYTSINQAGFIILGLCCNSLLGLQSSLFYLMTYMISMLVFFIVVIESELDLDNIKELISENATRRLLIILSLFSMAGIPPLMGFIGKYFIWLSLTDSLMSGLSLNVTYVLLIAFVVSVLTSLVSTFYYLRVIKVASFSLHSIEVLDSSAVIGALSNLTLVKGILVGLTVAWPLSFQMLWLFTFNWAISCRADWLSFY